MCSNHINLRTCTDMINGRCIRLINLEYLFLTVKENECHINQDMLNVNIFSIIKSSSIHTNHKSPVVID